MIENGPFQEAQQELNEDEILNRIDDIFDNVPGELRDIWETRIWHNDANATEALMRLEQLLRERSDALSKPKRVGRSEGELPAGMSKEEGERMSTEALEMAKEIVMRTDNVIGKGGTATVHTSKEFPGICYKYIFDAGSTEYTDHNDVFDEKKIMDEVYDLEVDGVRCPEPKFVFSQNGVTVLVMEELNAVSLKRVIHGGATLPDNFDFNRFFVKLEAYINMLHEQRRVHHRDLHGGNIMIDLDTADPRVIDFGRSVSGVLGGDDPYEVRDPFTGELKEKHIVDDSQISIHKMELRKALAERANIT